MNTIVANIRAFYRRTYWQWREAVTEYGDGYVLNYSGLRWLSGANHLWIDDPAVLTARFIEHCLRFFRPFMAEWSVLVIPEAQPGLKEVCLKNGCYIRWNSPIMVNDHPVSSSTGQNGIVIEPVLREEQANFARKIIGEAFQMDVEVNRRMVRPEHAADQTIHHYIGYYEGFPAAAATMTYDSGIASIWNVGTRRKFRKRGLATA